MVDAIILAGGENTKRLSSYCSQPYEALIDIAGRPMVTFVARALAASGRVRRIFVLGPAAALADCSFPPGTTVLEGGRTIMDTVRIGAEALGHSNLVLLATADIPLLTAEAVNHFLHQCSRTEADLYYPIVAAATSEAAYPGVKRTYVRFREGTFTGGNLFLANPAILPRCLTLAEEMVAHRKQPLRLCAMLGWSFLARLILGRLSLTEVEERVSHLFDIRGSVVQSPFAELGIDVDKPSDYELVKSAFACKA